VIASTVPISVGGIYVGGDHGVVSALDAETGEVVWEFDTVEDGLWGNPEVNSGGGAWYPPVVDLERGLVYVGTANPAPFPGTAEFPNGTSRPGDNLYTDSIVALDLHTGELAWYHQVTPHDIFDRDQVHTLMAEVDGEDVIVSAGKSGVLVGLDPDDGTVLWQAEVGVHDNDDLTELDGPTFINPGTYGGILTPPRHRRRGRLRRDGRRRDRAVARRDGLLRSTARHRGRRGQRGRRRHRRGPVGGRRAR
jgi:glucose dehydrogenase